MVCRKYSWTNPKWFDDFHTYDVGEIFTSSFGIACAVFSVKKNDRKKLEEILGQMSILSILSANPLMGVSVVFITFHQYFLNQILLTLKIFQRAHSNNHLDF